MVLRAPPLALKEKYWLELVSIKMRNLPVESPARQPRLAKMICSALSYPQTTRYAQRLQGKEQSVPSVLVLAIVMFAILG